MLYPVKCEGKVGSHGYTTNHQIPSALLRFADWRSIRNGAAPQAGYPESIMGSCGHYKVGPVLHINGVITPICTRILYFGPADVIQKFLAIEKYQERLQRRCTRAACSIPSTQSTGGYYAVAECQFCLTPSAANLEGIFLVAVELVTVTGQCYFVRGAHATCATGSPRFHVGRPGASIVSRAADLASRKNAVRSRTSPVPQSGAQ